MMITTNDADDDDDDDDAYDGEWCFSFLGCWICIHMLFACLSFRYEGLPHGSLLLSFVPIWFIQHAIAVGTAPKSIHLFCSLVDVDIHEWGMTEPYHGINVNSTSGSNNDMIAPQIIEKRDHRLCLGMAMAV